MVRLTFEERNQNNNIKYSNVSIETINKYKGKLPKLQYGQCYGYVPALVLGGKVSK